MLLIPLTFSSSKLSSQQAEYAFDKQLEFKLETAVMNDYIGPEI
jgi:hypothetical protein